MQRIMSARSFERPYDEIGGIYSVHADGTKVAIIENGRFVLPGTEMLNEPFKEAK